MSDLFSCGCFVRLQIGGEPMSIVGPDELLDQHWICSWVDSDGVVQSSSIHQKLLKFIGKADMDSHSEGSSRF